MTAWKTTGAERRSYQEALDGDKLAEGTRQAVEAAAVRPVEQQLTALNDEVERRRRQHVLLVDPSVGQPVRGHPGVGNKRFEAGGHVEPLQAHQVGGVVCRTPSRSKPPSARSSRIQAPASSPVYGAGVPPALPVLTTPTGSMSSA